jgi:hypothetical protein
LYNQLLFFQIAYCLATASVLFQRLQFILAYCFRMSYPNKYEIYRRVDELNGKENYILIAEFTNTPTPDDITRAFTGRKM